MGVNFWNLWGAAGWALGMGAVAWLLLMLAADGLRLLAEWQRIRLWQRLGRMRDEGWRHAMNSGAAGERQRRGDRA